MKKIISFLSIVLVLASCKKEKNEEPATSGGNNNGNNNPNSSVYYGALEAQKTKMYYFFGDTLAEAGWTSTLANAQFSSQPFASGGGTVFGTSISGGTVSLNGVSFKLNQNTGTNYYTDTTYTISFPPQSWNITGSSQVPTINYINNDSFPVVNTKPVLADTIYKSTGFTIPFSGVSGYDEVKLYMGSGSGFVLQTYPSTTSSVTISPSQLASFSTGNINFQLIYSKNNTQTFGGKNYRFKSSIMIYVGSMVLQP